MLGVHDGRLEGLFTRVKLQEGPDTMSSLFFLQNCTNIAMELCFRSILRWEKPFKFSLCLSWMWRPALITIAISILCCFFFLCCFPASDVSLNVRNHKTEKITKPKNVVCTQSIGNGFLFPYEEVKIKQKFWSVSQSCMESSFNGREGNNFYKWV